jgi:hypothetical protein
MPTYLINQKRTKNHLKHNPNSERGRPSIKDMVVTLPDLITRTFSARTGYTQV